VNPKFTSWTIGAPYYLPLLALSIIAQLVANHFGYLWVPTPLWLLFLFTLNFFRDPPRSISRDPEIIVSPADGVVDAIEELDESPHYDGPCICVSIFLNVFNVHINRAPDECTIKEIVYKEGEFRNAMDPESRQINESNTIHISTPHGPMTVRQISGAIARRIVCVTSEGKQLTKGAKFGMIKFGSRTELYMDPSATVLVNTGQKVKGGSTDIAKFAKK
jgi:phosphatidylserine decarboxylase